MAALTLKLWRWLWCIALDWLPLESRLFRWIDARYMAAIVGAKSQMPPVKRFSDEFMGDLMADVESMPKHSTMDWNDLPPRRAVPELYAIPSDETTQRSARDVAPVTEGEALDCVERNGRVK